MNAFLLGLMIVLGCSVVSVAGMLLVRKLIGVENLESFNEVAGNKFQVVGTLYAVLLGLIVVDAMTSMSDLRVTIEKEANAVANVFILSKGMPPPTAKKVQAIAIKYVDTVIDEEWELMKKCSFSKVAALSSFQLWDTLIDFKPEDDNQQEIRSLALSSMMELGDNRRTRLLSSVHGVSTEVWSVLLVGGVLLIIFSYFFGLKNAKVQMVMTAIIASSVSLNVYLIYMFGYPFSGVYVLEPEGFIADRAVFQIRARGLELPDQKNIDINQIKQMKGNVDLLEKLNR